MAFGVCAAVALGFFDKLFEALFDWRKEWKKQKRNEGDPARRPKASRPEVSRDRMVPPRRRKRASKPADSGPVPPGGTSG